MNILMNKFAGLFFIILIIIFPAANCFSQAISYFKDFDYNTLKGIDKLQLSSLPAFYVKCASDKNGALAGLGTVIKMDLDAYHLDNGFARVIYKNNRPYFFYGAGKTRNGYTRAIFQNKVYETDTAYSAADTLIFKHTSGRTFISVQLFTAINTDKPEMKELYFDFTGRKEKELSPLADFNNYKSWYSIDSAANTITLAHIDLKADSIVRWEYPKHPEGYVTQRINYTRKQYNENATTLPVSLFWLKNMGFIY